MTCAFDKHLLVDVPTIEWRELICNEIRRESAGPYRANPGMKHVSADCQVVSQFDFKWPRVTGLDAI
jgi:hypothetical protein